MADVPTRAYCRPPGGLQGCRALSPVPCLHLFTWRLDISPPTLVQVHVAHGTFPHLPSSFTYTTYPMTFAGFSLSLPFTVVHKRFLTGTKEILSPQSWPFKTNTFLETQKSYSRRQRLDTESFLCAPAMVLLILPRG